MAKATAEIWKRRVEAWHASGLSSQDFAAREGLRATTLAWWRSELKRRNARKPKATPTFLPVQVTERGPAPIAFVELELVSGHVLRVERGFDVETVKRLVAAVGGGR